MTNPLAMPDSRRRNFTEVMKRHIVDETCREGVSVSEVARQYGLAPSVLFRWRSAFGLGPAREPVSFASVEIAESEEPPPRSTLPAAHASRSIVIERAQAAIEVELTGGRRVQFAVETDPETVRRTVHALEATAP